jgi:hypothetical protein
MPVVIPVPIPIPVPAETSGERHQSAPSAVALTDEALTQPDENSMPALTHLHGKRGPEPDPTAAPVPAPAPARQPGADAGTCVACAVAVAVESTSEKSADCACGAAPVKMTSPPWSPSCSQSALTVTSATTKGCRRDVKTIGAVDVSPLGGLRQRSVFGPAGRVKYSMHWGSSKLGGRLRGVNEVPAGGIVAFLGGNSSFVFGGFGTFGLSGK